MQITLEVTTAQMREICDVMDGGTTVAGTVELVAETPAAEIFTEAPAAVAPVAAEAPATTTAAEAPAVAPTVTPNAVVVVSPEAAAVAPATTTAAPVPPASVELDVAGHPWDVRINAKSKNKTVAGKWKYIKGMDRSIIPAIEAELLAGLAAPAAPAVVAAVAPVPPVVPTTATATVASATVATVATPAAPVTPVAPVAGVVPTDFAGFLAVLGAAKVAGTVNDGNITVAVNELGLPNIGQLATRLDLIPTACNLLGLV